MVFTPGCTFRCPYCHNPELVLAGGGYASVSMPDLFRFLEKRRGRLDGVVITGGEPTIQPGLAAFMERLREMGYLVKLDTNGSRPDVMRDILGRGLADYVAMDVKAPPDKYAEVAGTLVNLTAIAESIDVIRGAGVPYEFRTTYVPSLLSPDDILAVARMIRGAAVYVLQGFVPSKHVDGSFSGRPRPPVEALERLAEACRAYVGRCVVR